MIHPNGLLLYDRFVTRHFLRRLLAYYSTSLPYTSDVISSRSQRGAMNNEPTRPVRMTRGFPLPWVSWNGENMASILRRAKTLSLFPGGCCQKLDRGACEMLPRCSQGGGRLCPRPLLQTQRRTRTRSRSAIDGSFHLRLGVSDKTVPSGSPSAAMCTHGPKVEVRGTSNRPAPRTTVCDTDPLVE